MQKLIYPMKVISFTQVENEAGTSHDGILAVDMNGSNEYIENAYAPCDLKVLAVSYAANTVYFGSVEKVMCADGKERFVTLAFTHDDNISDNAKAMKSGKIYKSGEVCYQEGKKNAGGNHVHIEIAEGHVTTKVKKKSGYYGFKDDVALAPTDVFFALKGWNEVREGYQKGKILKWTYGREVETVPNRKVITYDGVTVSIIRAKGIATVIADGHTKQIPSYFTDHYLDADHDKVAMINGSLFWSSGDDIYANGIEVVGGVVTEMDDSQYDNVMAFGIGWDGYPTFATQGEIKGSIWNYRSALTAAFGLYKDGKRCLGDTTKLGGYTTKSGRTIFGYNREANEYVLIGFAGETGKSGLTGPQCLSLVEYIRNHICNVTDAVCMDGGGSVYQQYEGKSVINTSRKIKNTIAIYSEKGVIEDMKLRILAEKQKLALRKEYKFVYATVTEFDPFTNRRVTRKRWLADGDIYKILDAGERVDVVEPIAEIGKDGWQWFKVLYDGQELYAQYDSMAYVLEKI